MISPLGFCIFSVLGFMAQGLEVDVPSVAMSGTGLAFVAYPDLVIRFEGAPFWSISRTLPNFCRPYTSNSESI